MPSITKRPVLLGLAVATLAVLLACEGPEGPQGPQGPPGPPGPPGDGVGGTGGTAGAGGAGGTAGEGGAGGTAGSGGTAGEGGAGGTAGAGGAGGTGGAGGQVTLPLPTLEGHTPQDLVVPYDVQAAFNDDTFFFRLTYRGVRGVRHDYLRFTDGAWRREGGDRRDAQATLDQDPVQGETDLNSTIYEQRTSVMWNDPSAGAHVTNFETAGCFVTCHDSLRHMPTWETEHGEDTKYVDPELSTGGEGSRPLDLWHWRGARSGPIERADDQHILAKAFTNTAETDDGGRKGDAGAGVFRTNELVDGHPSFVFNPTSTSGLFAPSWEEFWRTPYFFATDPDAATLGPFAPNGTVLAWDDAVAQGYVPAEGDFVPRRILRAGEGSRADITANGTTFEPESPDGEFGVWRVELQRSLATGTDDDVQLAAGKSYGVGFEVHLWEYTTRDHYVSFPMSLSLDDVANPAPDIAAKRVAGSGALERPSFDDEAAFPLTRLYLFQPGITSWEFLTNRDTGATFIDAAGQVVDNVHGGAASVETGTACRTCHTVRAEEGGLPMETLVPQRGGVFEPTPVGGP